MARIPYPDLDKASAEVREMLGRLPAPANIFNMMAHAETCVKPMMKLGGTLLGKLELDPKLRELCLLHAVKLVGGEYEWVQHVRSPAISAVATRKLRRLAKATTARLASTPAKNPRCGLRAKSWSTSAPRTQRLPTCASTCAEREIVELILMAGFYTTLARLTETLGVETEAPMGSALIRQIEMRVAANKART